ncbi:MAG: D-tyrosyl-tRNA(Tyr) deacylase [Ruminococcaceae bacterium]|jgi:D-tyrosyl-tRNA(Tyr) deacylase|nr:D-tyrosyl-tRNA(Tyr) deacylase [Oscillospiraceae bacterium]
MRAVIQRVLSSSVAVDGKTVGEVNKGYMVLLGVVDGDTQSEAELLARKTAMLRVFEDENGKMNLSVLDVDGEILCISQFTLCADTKKGNRPSFTPSAEPTEANRLYDYFCEQLKANGVKRVEKGVFGADMKVSLINDGPVTICLDTDTWSKTK